MSFHSEEPSRINKIQDCSKLIGQFRENMGDTRGSGSMSVSQSLVLDNKRGELVKTCGKVAKKGEGSAAKSVAALKSHSEAERRRRERINAHLATLRGLVPANNKMDKATLLAEVIGQVKELKRTAKEASDGLLIPLDSDEVRVEHIEDNSREGTLSFRAFLCCNFRPGLLSDIRQAIDTLDLNLVRSEISTLEGQVKTVLFLSTCSRKGETDSATKTQEQLLSSIHQAMSSILDKDTASLEYSPRKLDRGKRQRISNFESSSSSS